jgi:type III pantothenate kinase
VLLTIDVGNTETKLGIFSKGDEKPRETWRVTTELRRTADEYGVFFTQLFTTGGVLRNEIDAIAIASVVPKLDNVLEAACDRFFGVLPVYLKPHRQALIEVDTERPSEVGADLIAAAIGARKRYGQPLIVISYGTATVFMAIASDGKYVGVAIAPGINISIDALIGRTAKLPQISLEDPGHALGRNTIEALQAGIVYGFVGQTEALVARFRAEMQCEARVIATGGLAEVLAKHSAVIDIVDPYLSLEGLRLYYESLRA